MKVIVNGSTMVKPMKETPGGSVWCSNLDLIFPMYHTTTVYFYHYCSGSASFFDAAVLKAALARVLFDFYPYAGRLREDGNGRMEINCNGEGAAFVEAECDGALADLGSFSPNADIILTPTVDYSKGFATDHHASDGVAVLHFITTWADIARGKTATALPPSFDRRPLAARDPPRPGFPHIEHHPAPSLKTAAHDPDTRCSTFRLTRDQIDALKRRCGPNHTTYEVVAGHVWRCATAARGLPDDQQTKLQLPVESRRRVRPPLPAGFFGNAIFLTGAFAACGELVSSPLRFAAGKVREAIGRMDNEYLRSAVDYMELHPPRITRDGGGANFPNMRIISWAQLPFYEADFGWGKPAYVGPGLAPFEGKSYLCVDPQNEGSLMLIITLYKDHMARFQELLFDQCSFTMSNI